MRWQPLSLFYEVNMATISETLFKKFCTDENIPCTKIEEENSPTPDYRIEINGVKIGSEVKEINDTVIKGLSEEIDQGVFLREREQGKHVRSKLKSSSKQLKLLSKQGTPCFTIIYDKDSFFTEPGDYSAAMYGNVGLRIYKKSKKTEFVRGGKRTFTAKYLSAISAVCNFNQNLFGKDQPGLELYHNVYAINRVNPIEINHCKIKQFTKIFENDNDFSLWYRITFNEDNEIVYTSLDGI
jgi:hypothetical protein